MTRRVEEDPELVGIWLHVGLARPEGDNRRLAGIEVVDLEIEMTLLRMIGTRPDGRPMVGSQLEGQGGPDVTAQFDPAAVVADVIQLHPVMPM